MGISRATLYEIAGNPDDIVVSHKGPNKKTGMYMGFMTRGPNHNYKLLVSTTPVFDTADDAEKEMREVIEWAKTFTEIDIAESAYPTVRVKGKYA